MSQDNSQGTDNTQGTPINEPASSWGAPPSTGTPPPPPPDATGAVPAPSSSGGGGLSLSVDNPVALVLGIVAIAGVVLGLLLSADQETGFEGTSASVSFWDQMGWTWAILGIVAAAATLLPLLGKSIGLSAKQVTSVVTIAAGVLGLWWVLFILPSINSNRAFLATVGVLAAAGAAWVSRDPSEAS